MEELVTLNVCWEMLAKMMGIDICCMRRPRVRGKKVWPQNSERGVRVASWVLAVFTKRGNRAETSDFEGRMHSGDVRHTPGSQYILNE